MFEKVNPAHPDKVADRIAGALVDFAYSISDNPKIAVEVLIGHGDCLIIAESSVHIDAEFATNTARRISGDENLSVRLDLHPQDAHLAANQQGKLRCGDNGIFKGLPVTSEERRLTELVREVYKNHPYDGKYILVGNRIIACQSNVKTAEFMPVLKGFRANTILNPLGDWTGGIDVDSGATNRKLGSDMGGAVTGGGLHGKDLSKADVSVNIYAHIRAEQTGEPVELYCAIGDEYVDGLPYSAVVEVARDYIQKIGGFEKFAEWGLIR